MENGPIDELCCVFCGERFRSARAATAHENNVHGKRIRDAQTRLKKKDDNTKRQMIDITDSQRGQR